MKDRIKQIRSYFGLSQQKFANRVNKSAGFISNVETGRSGISDETLQLICMAFGVDELWLRTGSGEMFRPGKMKEEADKSGIGERIKQIRKREGLTQEQFANSLGFHKNQVYNIENDKSIPSDDFVSKVSKNYGVRIDWILFGQGEMDTVSDGIDEELISWLRENPDVVRELRLRGGLD